jgi:hypothetical protein
MKLKKIAVAALIGLATIGATSEVAWARQGADDPAGHVRHGGGADDAAGHQRHGRGADDAAGHQRHGGGADDGPNHQ